jgi:predicted AAA+ superfamily ATPase
LDAATPGEAGKPSKNTVLTYRDLLDNLFITDRVPPWLPTGTDIRTFAKAEKHFLVDSGLALALLKLSYKDLLRNKKLGIFEPEAGNTLFGKFFESLVCSSLKTYCDKLELELCHYRSSDGRREIDFIIEEKNHVLAIEVKGNRIPSSDDFKHLNWLESKISPKRKITKILINIGDGAYRDKSGVFIVPLDLLGP